MKLRAKAFLIEEGAWGVAEATGDVNEDPERFAPSRHEGEFSIS